MEDDEYDPTNDELEVWEREIEPQIMFTRKANIRHLREGNKKGNFIPSMSVAKFLKTNKKAENIMAMDILEKDSYYRSFVVSPVEIGEVIEKTVKKVEKQGRIIAPQRRAMTRKDDRLINHLNLNTYLDTEPLNDKEIMTVAENEDLNISSGARSKLKSKYFNDKNLKTKEERLKNKPSHLSKVEWKFLVDYWSEEAVMENSKKASESRAHQKMPHYNGTKSFSRTRQEIAVVGGECSSAVAAFFPDLHTIPACTPTPTYLHTSPLTPSLTPCCHMHAYTYLHPLPTCTPASLPWISYTPT
uniref:Uncharacterized protein n=1 Tax=Chenopodium quinoa TaxID=63459 RepID=A0A803N6Z1_CHEQI